MLVPFIRMCKFRIYMRSKLAKYVLKVLILCDARTSLFLDNSFTSIELAEQLKLKGLTSVGTARKTGERFLLCSCPKKDRPLHSTEFAFTKDKTLVSYFPKKNSAVVLISSMQLVKSFLNKTRSNRQRLVWMSCTRSVLLIQLDDEQVDGHWQFVNAHVVLGATKDSDNITRCDFIVSLGIDLIKRTSYTQICYQKPTKGTARNYFKNN
ncbi:hypothetical protein PR048_016826 [Dryococelus australis]|uniref:PiggyBac transposable element-derived protein domain-containing protein n=1 Tax=Dryococelus australis TaxID=614101 RepID=A0ABQ9H7V7_9NEOP|nr:hypothetical protein PR048_016826 [Dryococelus australis]